MWHYNVAEIFQDPESLFPVPSPLTVQQTLTLFDRPDALAVIMFAGHAYLCLGEVAASFEIARQRQFDLLTQMGHTPDSVALMDEKARTQVLRELKQRDRDQRKLG